MTIDLLDQILPHIKNSIYPFRIAIPDWKMKTVDPESSNFSIANDKSGTPIRIPFQWKKLDKSNWFKQYIQIPDSFVGTQVALIIDLHNGLVFINGHLQEGIDPTHREIVLTNKAKFQHSFLVSIFVNNEKKHELNTFNTSDLVVVDPTARQLYHGLIVLRELEEILEHNSSESREVHELIRRTLIFLKYFKPGSEEYPHAIQRALNFLNHTIETECKSTIPNTIHLVFQPQINSAFLWNRKDAIQSSGSILSHALTLAEEYPDFKFVVSQASLLKVAQEFHPELYRHIKQKIHERKIEIACCIFCIPDFCIPNGESLVRHLLYSKRFFDTEVGEPQNIFWLSSISGCTASFPQVLRNFGFQYLGCEVQESDARYAHSKTCMWQGIDGTQILTHIYSAKLGNSIGTKDFLKAASSLPFEPIDGLVHTLQLLDSEVLAREQLNYALAIKNVAGLPTIRLSSIKEFFQALTESPSPYPVYEENFLFNAHRGKYTYPGWLKRENRKCENLLYTTELFSVLAMLFARNSSSRRYPGKEIQRVWDKVLLHQSNFIISGSASSDIYNTVKENYRTVKKECTSLLEKSIRGISFPVPKNNKEIRFSIFNALQWDRGGYIEFSFKSKEKYFRVFTEDGQELESQILSSSKGMYTLLCYIPDIQSFSSKEIIIQSSPKKSTVSESWKSSTHGIETPYYKVRFDNKGSLSSLYAKHLRRELVQKGKRANVFHAYRDVPKQSEMDSSKINSDNQKYDLWHFKNLKFIELGPLRATVRIDYRSDHHSLLSQEIYFYHKLSQIDFHTHMTLNEKHTFMQAVFPLNIKSPTVTNEIQFGAIVQRTHDLESSVEELPTQQWIDLSEIKYGISLLNDGKYGYFVKDNILFLSLISSSTYQKSDAVKTIDPSYIDLGEHEFLYSLYPHAGNWKVAHTIKQARELNNKLLVVPNIRMNIPKQFIHINKNNIIIDSIKKAEDSDDIIFRMHEGHGELTDSVINFNLNLRIVEECDLSEKTLREHKIMKSKLSIRFKPFEIKTLKFLSKPSPQKKRKY